MNPTPTSLSGLSPSTGFGHPASHTELVLAIYCTYGNVHVSMGYYSVRKRNTFESVLMRWLNLEPIIQSEINQKEKEKYCILTHIRMEFRKMILMIPHSGQHRRHRFLDSVGEGEGGMI